MNKFYNQNLTIQWVVASIMIIIALLIFFLWAIAMKKSILGVLLVFIITPICQFLIAPMMKLTGVYTYVSPMLLIYSANDKRYDLHNGTSFDYLFVYPGNKSGIRWQNRLLYYYLEGLLKIIQDLEDDKIPDTIEVRGSTYFFSEQTAARLGFETKKTGGAEKFNLLINYLDLVWTYSLAKGKLSLPNLFKIQTATTTGKKLMEKKEDLQRLRDYLLKRSSSLQVAK